MLAYCRMGAWILVIGAVAVAAHAQTDPPAPLDRRLGESERVADLPTGRALEELTSPPLVGGSLADDSGTEPSSQPPTDFARLLRPRVELQLEWEPIVDGLGLWGGDVLVQVPTYPLGGPPPPLITWGYSWTEITAPSAWRLPETLHDLSLGLAWVRRINDRWTARFTLSSAFASDWENTSSAAWQIRGGAFAMYAPNERWNWAFGALATGREDLPVIPAIGAVWRPSPDWNINLMFPTPRVSRLIYETAQRQHWAYVGAGFTGGTWAYGTVAQEDSLITYREWRAGLGWESTPPVKPGEFRALGTRYNFELGYVFGREFEFETLRPTITPSDGWLLRAGFSY